MREASQTLKHPFPWQRALWAEWLRLLQADRLPHAVLLSGLAGLGKRHLAEAFAQALLCSGTPETRPCGRCKACRLLEAGSHPDLRIVEPEEAGKAIRIDQIRGLVNFLGETAQQGGWKCVIIQPAEAMNSHAANALLKSLEEPPGQTLIILVSSAPSQLMATLRSRCRQLQVLPPTRDEALAWLEPRVGSRAAELLDYAHGAPCAALAAGEEDRLGSRGEILEALLTLAQGRAGTLDAARVMQGFAKLEALNQILDLLNDVARAQLSNMILETRPEEWGTVAARIDPQLLFRYRDKVLQAKSLLLGGGNPNKQLLWEELMFDWQALSAARRHAARRGA